VSEAERGTRELLVELLHGFYARGWVSGTGGGIYGPADDAGLLLAPTGVHKERIRPDEFFTVDPADGSIRSSPADPSLRPSECNSIFCPAVRERAARSVVHSHALSAVLAGDLARDTDHIAIRDLEMLKGIRVHLIAHRPS
jgi:methylthioribulose-1-phosphate dehydratase